MTKSKDKKSSYEIEKYEEELLSPSNLAVLLILSEGSMYGYQINKIIETRGMDHWVDLKFSTVYKSLDELNKKGLIIGKKEVIGVKTAKKIYSMTDEGKKILVHQIKLALTNPPHSKEMFDLGLAGIYHLSKKDRLNALSQYQRGLEGVIYFFEDIIGKLDNIDEIAKKNPDQIVAGESASKQKENPYLFIVKALFERPYHRIKGELDWLIKFMKEIKEIKRDE